MAGKGGTSEMQSPYAKLALALTINAVLMFFITYSMLASLDHFYFTINRVYMSLMMVAPMAIVMLVVMRSMYSNLKLNAALIAGFALLFVGTYFFARYQVLVGDEEFLRAMIPHHSSAILMCEEASISDPEIQSLCSEIIAAQEREIAEMKELLGEG